MSEAKTLMDFVKAAKSRITEISIDEVTGLQAEGYQVLDVREPNEYVQGTLENAMNIPRGLIEAACDPNYPGHRKEMIDRDKPWLILCATGGRSAMVTDVMQQMGFNNVKNINGGMCGKKQTRQLLFRNHRHYSI